MLKGGLEMTWKCERNGCDDDYQHKHLCDCKEFELVWVGCEFQYWCSCSYEDFFGRDDEEDENYD